MPSTHHGILIHAMWSTKGRAKVLDKSWRDELYAFMGGTARKHDASLLCAGRIEDHVHLLLKTHPSFAIADTIKLVKGNASRWINAQAKLDCRFAWQRGYGAFSVSQSVAHQVKRYIEDQEQHHATKTFEEEYVALLRKHRIEFDPRFVFDKEFIG